ncbi:PREDICTED: protein SDE2 homolog [Papilio polytes]|uniref:protein SDE2 homolog n=1 Tax=Papilio polytes TaxID=76194 RepID=UPI000676827E|nr:PREDICTED: protein SDE2 homolog [Papilio polytes]
MACHIYFENNFISDSDCSNTSDLRCRISQAFGIPQDDLFITVNGRIVSNEFHLGKENVVRVHTRLVGGKGGFGSMLRAIGAQIEKTTNREACRDLSGRRLRDINEEIEVNLNADYEKGRQELPERVSAAVDAGWVAAESSQACGSKRKIEDTTSKGKKKAKLWIDAELSDCSSLSEDDEEETKMSPEQTVSTDSGNESDRASEASSKV